MTADITLHIERLVVDSEVLDGADPRGLADAVRAELGALLESRGLPAGLAAGVERGTLRGGSLPATGSLAAGIAGAVHTGLSSSSGRATGHRP